LKVRLVQNQEIREIKVDPGQTLARNLFVEGAFQGVALCSGLGTCGQCALLFHQGLPGPSLKDLSYYSREELERGLRLACTHYPAKGQSFEIMGTKTPGQMDWAGSKPVAALGIDLGTTFVKWGFMHLDGRVSHGLELNSQMGAGADIMSRLSFAQQGPEHYKFLVRLLRDQAGSVMNLSRAGQDNTCVTGNPAMIHFLLNRDIQGLCSSPYSLDFRGGAMEALGPREEDFFVPALWSAFLGADISAGLSWVLDELRPDYPFLLADFGTNGELVLAVSPDRFLATSVALGPALEGVGLRFGSPYRDGVASCFVLKGHGLEARDSWNTGKVSGSGYISLLAHLLRLKIILPSGHFNQDQGPMARRFFRLRDGRLSFGTDFYLDGQDIEEILKVKAAFTLGLSFLCRQGKVPADRIRSIYIAGALGEHSHLADLETLGFFPPGSSHKSRVMGNTSLKGALLLAGDKGKRRDNADLARFVETVNLGSEHEYMSTLFARHMIFEYPGSPGR
jgi:uncharacterized 2Fe-2S/4Fe-4S cluster protein (DUF4445 family)